MPAILCKVCQEPLESKEDSGCVVCQACGSEQTVSTALTDEKTSLINRITQFRAQKEFPTAAVLCQEIIMDYPDDPESQWNKVLCKYGVVYELQPQTGSYQLALHEACTKSIYDDRNYKLALQKATPGQRQLYEKEAAQIDAIYKAKTFDSACALQELGDDGSIKQALALFESLGDYPGAADHKASCETSLQAGEKKSRKKESALVVAVAAIAVMAVAVTVTMNFIIPSQNYAKAQSYLAAGDYTNAITTFESLGTFSDAADQALSARAERQAKSLENPRLGDTVYLGDYEQDYDALNGAEDIAWTVLDIEDGKILVLSQYALEAHDFNDELSKGNEWESSDLRSWMNGEFKSAAFSSDEQALLQGEVFCLSTTEAEYYFADNDDRVCYVTTYAKKQGVLASDSGECSWWLRDSQDLIGNASTVNAHGAIDEGGLRIVDQRGCVRPAIWISVPSAKASDGQQESKHVEFVNTNNTYKNTFTPDTSIELGTLEAVDKVANQVLSYGVQLYSYKFFEDEGTRKLQLTFLNFTDGTIGSMSFYVVGTTSDGKVTNLSPDLDTAEDSSVICSYTYPYKFTAGEAITITISNLNENVDDIKCIATTYTSLGVQMDNVLNQHWVQAIKAVPQA